MKEYGGYLPLELNNTGEYYNFPAKNMIKTNSGLTAIYCALKMAEPCRVFLPFYICPSVDELVKLMGFKIVHYNINNKFEPDDLYCNDNDCIILVNYFGINTKMIKKYYSKYCKVIVDNTEAFFAKPIMEDNVYNVYSCRKFIGVSDGGYLIGNELKGIDMEQDFSSTRSSFLMMQYEYGVNGAYGESKDSYEQIKSVRKNMSALTEKILCSADYQQIKEKRITNFNTLDMLLKSKNELIINRNQEDIPYSYPFMIKRDIRSRLIKSKIYVPWIWKEKSNNAGLNITEQEFVNFIYHLPIDQRYDKLDMQCIYHKIIDILEDKFENI